MRVVWFCPYFQPAWGWGGPVRSSWATVRALAGEGVRVTVVASDAAPMGRVAVPAERLEEGVVVRTAPVPGAERWPALGRFGVAPGLARLLWEALREADLVHVEGVWGAVHPLVPWMCRSRGVPYVVTPRGTLESVSFGQSSTRKRWYLATVGSPLIRGAAAFHFTTEREREASVGVAGGRPAFVVGNPVAPLPHGDGRRFRARYGVRGGGTLFGMFGRLHPQKGHGLLVEALAGIGSLGDWRLVLVGPDEEGHGAGIREMASRAGIAGRLVVTGMLRQQELADAYAGVDVSVLPSKNESFGNVVVEAVGQGTPVVVSDRVGLAGWVEARRVGAVVRHEVSAWREVLGRCIRGWCPAVASRDEMVATAREDFAPEAVARQFIAAHRRLLRGEGAGGADGKEGACRAS